MVEGIKISEMVETETLNEDDLLSVVSEGINKKIKYKHFASSNKYMLGEQIIGTWIDGKPIYRRCYQYDGETSYDQNIVIDSSFKSSAIEHLIDCRFNYFKQRRVTTPNDLDIVVPRFDAQNDAVPKIHIEEGGLYITIHQTTYHKFTIIIEYTKNTEV